MKRYPGIVLVLLVMVSSPLSANGSSADVVIGGVEMSIKSPEGFVEISDISPQTRNIMEKFVPPTNRLLGLFVTQDDLARIHNGSGPEMNRYMMLQTNRQLEAMRISDSDFGQLSNQVREQQFTLMKKHRGEIDELVDHASKRFSDEYDTKFKVEVGEQLPLGVFNDQPAAIGIGFLGRYQIDVEGEMIDSVVASGVSYVLHENKLLYMYVYSSYRDTADIDWIKATTIDWVGSL